jgi:hypothetical protein
MQHWRAKPTDSFVRGKEADEKETTRKNFVALGEGEKCTDESKR